MFSWAASRSTATSDVDAVLVLDVVSSAAGSKFDAAAEPVVLVPVYCANDPGVRFVVVGRRSVERCGSVRPRRQKGGTFGHIERGRRAVGRILRIRDRRAVGGWGW